MQQNLLPVVRWQALLWFGMAFNESMRPCILESLTPSKALEALKALEAS